jgi:hypothetical protein
MSFYWKKIGRIFTPEKGGRHPSLASHAANPLAVNIDNDIYRIYYSGRDLNNRSSVGAIDYDLGKGEIVTDHYSPFFCCGPSGSFFEDGISIGCVYCVDSTRYMTFMGWQSPKNTHWRGAIGRLILAEDFSLRLDSEVPFIGFCDIDPISLSYPWISGDTSVGYRMWYGSTVTWEAGNDEMLHIINCATSTDGHQWTKLGQGVPFQIGLAQAFSRPNVLSSRDSGYDMWFSFRGGSGDTYRIGYAHSEDLVNWKLDFAKSGIDVSTSGWDSEMIEYPFVFDHKGERFMLYNGNGYGRTGFGLAQLAR